MHLLTPTSQQQPRYCPCRIQKALPSASQMFEGQTPSCMWTDIIFEYISGSFEYNHVPAMIISQNSLSHVTRMCCEMQRNVIFVSIWGSCISYICNVWGWVHHIWSKAIMEIAEYPRMWRNWPFIWNGLGVMMLWFTSRNFTPLSPNIKRIRSKQLLFDWPSTRNICTHWTPFAATVMIYIFFWLGTTA